MAEPPLPVLLVEVVESDRPVRYSLPEGMLSAIAAVVDVFSWSSVDVYVGCEVNAAELRLSAVS
jgi:hypothetical protein